MQALCPHCGAEVELAGEAVACHQCHEVFKAADLVRVPESSTLEYFGDRPGKKAEGHAFASREVVAAAILVVAAVAMGMLLGLGEPDPFIRRGGACSVFICGALGAGVALLALAKRRLGYVDRSLALTAVGLGVLCV